MRCNMFFFYGEDLHSIERSSSFTPHTLYYIFHVYLFTQVFILIKKCYTNVAI